MGYSIGLPVLQDLDCYKTASDTKQQVRNVPENTEQFCILSISLQISCADSKDSPFLPCVKSSLNISHCFTLRPLMPTAVTGTALSLPLLLNHSSWQIGWDFILQQLLYLLWTGDLAQQTSQYLKMKLIVLGLTSLKQGMHNASLFSLSILSTKICLKHGSQ